ncbi:hypothetical protein GGX14DRAFT_676685 [Mycena pura]|uniref:Uncharacterized protein n=1 Tax=Mycena pura TaxID=153505 RepID=A0AAD6Y246_9AGAR|nr:hypothetical protein GGX14DRAFT_676685 [Mycena pura]
MLFHGTRFSLIDSRFRVEGIEPPKFANALSSSEALYLTNSPVHTLLQVSTQQPIPFLDNRDPASLLVFRLNTKVLHGEIPPTASTDPFNVEYLSDTVGDREALCEETMYNMSLDNLGEFRVILPLSFLTLAFSFAVWYWFGDNP